MGRAEHQPPTAAPPVVAVVGPTAAGKTALSLDLAQAVGGEVVNADSMQLYRGMDIGTGKLPPEQRRGIAHHLIDVLDVTAPATVAEFQGWARAVIEDCRRRGVVPVLVGGSALYVRAVLDRFDFPGTDPQVRRRLEAELDRVGAERLHMRLGRLDPEAAERIEPGNGRRVVRALEVLEIGERPFAAALPGFTYHYARVLQIGVEVPRPVLDERIADRVRSMWAAGLVEEVRRLSRLGLREGRTASRALGYQQVLAFLDGEISEKEALDRTVAATRRFARRQDSWFRKDPRVSWLRWDDPEQVSQAISQAQVWSHP